VAKLAVLMDVVDGDRLLSAQGVGRDAVANCFRMWLKFPAAGR